MFVCGSRLHAWRLLAVAKFKPGAMKIARRLRGGARVYICHRRRPSSFDWRSSRSAGLKPRTNRFRCQPHSSSAPPARTHAMCVRTQSSAPPLQMSLGFACNCLSLTYISSTRFFVWPFESRGEHMNITWPAIRCSGR